MLHLVSRHDTNIALVPFVAFIVLLYLFIVVEAARLHSIWLGLALILLPSAAFAAAFYGTGWWLAHDVISMVLP